MGLRPLLCGKAPPFWPTAPFSLHPRRREGYAFGGAEEVGK
jgi:hypothetical protein